MWWEVFIILNFGYQFVSLSVEIKDRFELCEKIPGILTLDGKDHRLDLYIWGGGGERGKSLTITMAPWNLTLSMVKKLDHGHFHPGVCPMVNSQNQSQNAMCASARKDTGLDFSCTIVLF